MSTFQPNRGSDLHQHVCVFTAEPARLVGRGGGGCGGGGAVGTDGGGLGNALAALRKQELDHLARLATQGNRQARATRGRRDRGEPVGRHGLWPAGAPPAPSASVSTRQHTNQRPSSHQLAPVSTPTSARHHARQPAPVTHPASSAHTLVEPHAPHTEQHTRTNMCARLHGSQSILHSDWSRVGQGGMARVGFGWVERQGGARGGKGNRDKERQRPRQR